MQARQRGILLETTGTAGGDHWLGRKDDSKTAWSLRAGKKVSGVSCVYVCFKGREMILNSYQSIRQSYVIRTRLY